MQMPDELYQRLFRDVQLKKIFPDNKTFVDCTPNSSIESILSGYEKLCATHPSNEAVKKFVEDHFTIPPASSPGYHTNKKAGIADHIEELWNVLQRSADKAVKGSSLIPLPYPYIVPGGRFREVFYWDSYFTMLGLAESNRWEIIENMIDNFACLIHTFGFIPNGNRSYFLSRSQPPYFSCMIELLAVHKGDEVYKKYLPAMRKEYDYWMDKTYPTKHCVQLDNGTVLNRYYDQLSKPRPEAFWQDSALSEACTDASQLYRDLRAACESGWDFSGRWFKDGKTFNTIQTTSLLAVDLNCLLYHLEATICRGLTLNGDAAEADVYDEKAERRRKAINKYFYNAADGWYYDYTISEKKLNNQKTLAGFTPFFFFIPPEKYIDKAAAVVHGDFLKDGGLVTTLINTGQQWDWPNGWAPLHWITIKGLANYGKRNLAALIAKKWAALNIKVYRSTGRLMEKYNVIDTHLTAGGGEYPSQDGFGWTNGVLLKILKTYK
ncbi:trehalase family glycosidase [Parafilimonas sp.]|uniref:trehalase family glycosidase n=1 Tax=Parafilimonas sp. TaxID=1969739 RepID=UPI0039E22B81